MILLYDILTRKFRMYISRFIIVAYAWNDCPSLIGTASSSCVLPIFITPSNSSAFSKSAFSREPAALLFGY